MILPEGFTLTEEGEYYAEVCTSKFPDIKDYDILVRHGLVVLYQRHEVKAPWFRPISVKVWLSCVKFRELPKCGS